MEGLMGGLRGRDDKLNREVEGDVGEHRESVDTFKSYRYGCDDRGLGVFERKWKTMQHCPYSHRLRIQRCDSTYWTLMMQQIMLMQTDD